MQLCCLHGYRYQEHERQISLIAEEIGFTQISVSHQISPLMKIIPRGDTTVVDAYLSPILRRYVDQVRAELGPSQSNYGRLMFMQSNGGLTDANYFQGKDAILSGPAGGVVGMVKTGETIGLRKLIGFDMGGTSTDVCHYSGEYERTLETEVTGVRLKVANDAHQYGCSRWGLYSSFRWNEVSRRSRISRSFSWSSLLSQRWSA